MLLFFTIFSFFFCSVLFSFTHKNLCDSSTRLVKDFPSLSLSHTGPSVRNSLSQMLWYSSTYFEDRESILWEKLIKMNQMHCTCTERLSTVQLSISYCLCSYSTQQDPHPELETIVTDSFFQTLLCSWMWVQHWNVWKWVQKQLSSPMRSFLVVAVYVCACMCVCMHVCVCMCVHVCVHMCVWTTKQVVQNWSAKFSHWSISSNVKWTAGPPSSLIPRLVQAATLC